MSWVSRLGCGCLLLLSPRLAFGLGPAGSAIDTSGYTIDFYQGPITSSSRVIGLAGSIAPLIEGVGGFAVNPGSVAMRPAWSRDWWDWELDVGFTLPATISNTDFDNNGDETFATNAAAFFNGGLGFQFGAWGIGFRVERGEYGVESNGPSFPDYPRDLQVAVVKGHLVTGYAWGGGELVLGYGINVSSVELGLPGDDDDSSLISSVQGIAMQFGAVWAPPELPLRVGLSARIPISAEEALPDLVEPDAAGNYVSEGYYLPREIRLPTEIHAAVAVQWFRPLNVRWNNPDDAASADVAPATDAMPLPRTRRLLLAGAVQVTGPVTNGVGVESFFSQSVERSGDRVSISPRLGVEGEPLLDWLVLRAGSYLEPTRFETSSARLHATAGLDFHIPIAWSVFGLFDKDTTFRVGGAVDSAERYFAWSASAGIWR